MTVETKKLGHVRYPDVFLADIEFMLDNREHPLQIVKRLKMSLDQLQEYTQRHNRLDLFERLCIRQTPPAWKVHE